jgi:hypothetical protein
MNAMSESVRKLVLVGTAVPALQVGYGQQFRFEVLRVLAGEFDERTLRLNVLVKDREREAYLRAHTGQEIEARFVWNADDEPHSTAPITGFVDAGHTSWLLTDLREPSPH